MTRIGLGTVQFGAPYGITNAAGQVSRAEVARVLARAGEHGIDLIDTAALYGESEAAIGASLPRPSHFRIVTKTSKHSDGETPAAGAARLEATFLQSLDRLGDESVHGLMAHEADDLLKPAGPALWDAMLALKSRGRVARIGASVYTGAQIDGLLRHYPLDLVQIPINAVDRRLIDGGQLARLKARGVEVHARSIFLQGLLLADPSKIERRFGPLQACVAGLNGHFAAHGLSPLDGHLTTALQNAAIDCVIVGITSVGELDALAAAVSKAALAPRIDVTPWSIRDETVLSPALWAKLT